MSTANRSTVITPNGTNVILTGIGSIASAPCEGVLHTVTIAGSSTAASVLIYDNTSATGNPVAALAVGANMSTSAILDIQLQKGMTVVTAGFTGGNVTITFR